MILCDIGNTYFHFYHRGRFWKETPETLSLKQGDVFYISVNPVFEQKLLQIQKNCINLAPFFWIKTSYVGLGIDRIAGCEGLYDGILVDAGSAITIDMMQKGIHLGGYILPGIASFIQMYREISPALNVMPSLSIDLTLLPQNTQEALGYGILKSIISCIEQVSKDKKIYFCGGDGKFFSKFFPNAIYDRSLVFKGMQKALERYFEKNH